MENNFNPIQPETNPNQNIGENQQQPVQPQQFAQQPVQPAQPQQQPAQPMYQQQQPDPFANPEQFTQQGQYQGQQMQPGQPMYQGQPGQPQQWQQPYSQNPQNLQNPQNPAPAYGGYATYGADAAVVEKKNRAPLIIALVAVFVALAVAGALFYFFGFGGSDYEKAERNSFGALAEQFEQLTTMASDGVSEEGKITIIPSTELLDMLKDYTDGEDFTLDLGKIAVSYETIVEGSDIYASFDTEVLGLSLTTSFWSLGDVMVMQLPEISDYYIILGEMSSQLDDYSDEDIEAFKQEIFKIFEVTADKYFELTKDVESSGAETVVVGNLSTQADLYEIEIDAYFAAALMETFIEATLDSPTIMRAGEDLFAYMAGIDEYFYYGEDYYDFRSFLENGLAFFIDESKFAKDYDPYDVLYMNVYVDGKTVVKRSFIVEGDIEVYYASIYEGDNYAREFVGEGKYGVGTPDDRLYYLESGRKSGDAATGKIEIGYDDGYEKISATVNYSDFIIHESGAFSGGLEIIVPIPDNPPFTMTLKSDVVGDTQNITGSASVFGMKIFDIEIESRSNTGKTISKPKLSASNTLDISDGKDMEKFYDIIEEWFTDNYVEIMEALGIEDGGFGNVNPDFEFPDTGIEDKPAEQVDDDLQKLLEEMYNEEQRQRGESGNSLEQHDPDEPYNDAELAIIANEFKAFWQPIVGQYWNEEDWETLVELYVDEMLEWDLDEWMFKLYIWSDYLDGGYSDFEDYIIERIVEMD